MATVRGEEASEAVPIAELMIRANQHHQHGQLETAQHLCDAVLARDPSHVNALNLSGIIFQASGRHKQAIKVLTKAITCDRSNSACHYNLAASLEALDRRGDAESCFKKAIALGIPLKNVTDIILRNPAITACIDYIEQNAPFGAKADELFARHSLESIANDLFLRCALETLPLAHAALEAFLTLVRSTLMLGFATSKPGADKDAVGQLFCSIAQQCFINEYLYGQSDEETSQSTRLRDLLLQRSDAGIEIAPLLLIAVAAYFPLHSLPAAQSLSQRRWPDTVAGLIRQQLDEPLQEAQDRKSIVALTPIEDAISLQVMHQYEENPYPRWTVNPNPGLANAGEALAAAGQDRPIREILIAGCGSGQHAFEVAQLWPDSRVLAIDISLPSLAYARRKSREFGLRNIEYAQADILELKSMQRSFERIEAVGVLHHLEDPERGWRLLLERLRPNGEMRIGLYSETARRAVTSVRALIAERGYRPSPQDIRRLRQELRRGYDERGWRMVLETPDFYTMSGCRDLLFNVMEHQFTIPRIETFLRRHNLSFLGFDLEPASIARFRKQFPENAALVDLAKWRAFEADDPRIFRSMYVFTVRKN